MQQTQDAGEAVADAPAAANEVADVAFRTWHRWLQIALLVHLPVLVAVAVVRDIDLALALPLLAVPAALAAGASALGTARFRSGLVALGLAWCSVLLVQWTVGATEAHFHLLLIIVLVGLYRDPVPLAVAAGTAVVLYAGVAQVASDLVFANPAAIDSPLLWGLAYLLAAAGAVGVTALMWEGSRRAEDAVASHSTSYLLQEAEQRRRQELSAVYATVARRSQALLERQIQVIEGLEQGEENPTVLRQLFALDHLATRMNREAASMLVLAGGEPDRRVVGKPPVSEVVRGAVGEIEDYTRVDLALADDRDVEGRVVAGLVHLLSELIENATAYSPPGTRVTVQGQTVSDGGYVVRVVDRGIGLDDDTLQHHNGLLAAPPSGTPVDNQRLGLDVVARLVGRLGLPARLDHNDDGPGITALVVLPATLLGAPADGVLDDAPEPPPIDPPTAMPSSTSPPVRTVTPATRAATPRWSPAAQGGTVGTRPQTTPQAQPVVTPAREPVPVAAAAPAQISSRSTFAESDEHNAPARTRHAAAPPAAASGPSQSWSYTGHLRSRSRTPVAEPEMPRRSGRGSRSQIAGPAPRAEQAPVATSGPGGGDLAGILDAHRSGTGSGGDPSSWASQRSSGPSTHPADRPDGRTAADPPRDDAADPADVGTRAGEAAHDAREPVQPTLLRPSPAASAAGDRSAGPPAGSPQPGPDVPQEAGRTAGGLPRRARGAALPRALKDPEAVAAPRNAAVAPVSRDESRSLLSSYQSRLQAGRRAAEEQVAKSAGPPAADADDDDAGPPPPP